MSYTPQEYLDSIESSLEDLRACAEQVPVSVLRDLDRQVEAIRDLWVEYLVPARGKTLIEVFAEEEQRRKRG